MSGHDLAFDLQSDVKEEQNHEAVVDPCFEGLTQSEVVETDGQVAL